MRKLKEIVIRNVKDLYKGMQILSDSSLEFCGDKYVLYEIEPINVLSIGKDKQAEIFSQYKQLVSIFNACKIIYISDYISFDKQINMCQKRIKEVKSNKLKEAISSYIIQLKSINKEIRHTGKFYLACNINDSNAIENNIEGFVKIGMNVERIKDEEQLRKVIKKFIIKESV